MKRKKGYVLQFILLVILFILPFAGSICIDNFVEEYKYGSIINVKHAFDIFIFMGFMIIAMILAMTFFILRKKKIDEFNEEHAEQIIATEESKKEEKVKENFYKEEEYKPVVDKDLVSNANKESVEEINNDITDKDSNVIEETVEENKQEANEVVDETIEESEEVVEETTEENEGQPVEEIDEEENLEKEKELDAIISEMKGVSRQIDDIIMSFGDDEDGDSNRRSRMLTSIADVFDSINEQLKDFLEQNFDEQEIIDNNNIVQEENEETEDSYIDDEINNDVDENEETEDSTSEPEEIVEDVEEEPQGVDAATEAEQEEIVEDVEENPQGVDDDAMASIEQEENVEDVEESPQGVDETVANNVPDEDVEEVDPKTQGVDDAIYAVEEPEENVEELVIDNQEVNDEADASNEPEESVEDVEEEDQEVDDDEELESNDEELEDENSEEELDDEANENVESNEKIGDGPKVHPIDYYAVSNPFVGLKGTKTKSFNEKLDGAAEDLKNNYAEIKNELLSYKKVRSRITKTTDNFHKGRVKVAKLVISGKSLKLFLKLDVNAYAQTKYHQKDMSEKKKYAETPFMIKIKSAQSIKKAKALILDLMNNYETTKNPKYENLSFEDLTKKTE